MSTPEQRLRARHWPEGNDPELCHNCDQLWPCDTIAALDEARERVLGAVLEASSQLWFGHEEIATAVERARQAPSGERK